MDSLPLWIGVVVASSLAAAGLVAPGDPRRRLVLLAGALVLAPVLIAADNWDTDRFVDLRDSPAMLGAAGIAALIALAVLVLLVRRLPGWLPIALIALLPFRMPIDLGGETANLLLPLYGAARRGPDRGAARARAGSCPPYAGGAGTGERLADLRRWIAPVLAASLVLYGLQSGYTDDASTAVENVSFFFVPFAALFVLARRRPLGPRAAAAPDSSPSAAVALAVALIGFAQYVTGELFWNDKVIDGNEAHAYFRVNSVFYDPNIMGRFLAVALVILAAVVAWGRRRDAQPGRGARSWSCSRRW